MSEETTEKESIKMFIDHERMFQNSVNDIPGTVKLLQARLGPDEELLRTLNSVLFNITLATQTVHDQECLDKLRKVLTEALEGVNERWRYVQSHFCEIHKAKLVDNLDDPDDMFCEECERGFG